MRKLELVLMTCCAIAVLILEGPSVAEALAPLWHCITNTPGYVPVSSLIVVITAAYIHHS